ncbi:hypothetical protein NQ314_019999 [Rhamnusium bicolor]|uniref:Microtubule-associated protein Jupiter n=1 Tax=Rhamnusium bicolor TaxID=1586634 RepID=A0AAV8WM06_9CUCU|nr:hypothetical protein NQ314_019999 [Rhamnusium bicolor]
MANVFVGFHDQRNSSRVLKPPGGGTSDIFGTDAPKNTKNGIEPTPNKRNELNIATKPVLESDNQSPSDENSKNGSCEENVEQERQSESKTQVKAGITTESISSIIQQRDVQIKEPEKEKKTGHRVPPGGYSSGLW